MLIADLEETFQSLHKVNIMLNPNKCVFGVTLGKLLGFLVSHRGIEANPDKIRAIEEMQPPRRLKDMQRLAGCMAALGRFISKFGDKALPFFKIMKRTGPFKWTSEAATAFEDLKRYLASPPILIDPRPREPLRLYLAATPKTASAALMAEREAPVPLKKRMVPPTPASLDEESTPAPPREDIDMQQDPPQESHPMPQENHGEP